MVRTVDQEMHSPVRVPSGSTPLHMAAMNGSIAIVQAILQVSCPPRHFNDPHCGNASELSSESCVDVAVKGDTDGRSRTQGIACACYTILCAGCVS